MNILLCQIGVPHKAEPLSPRDDLQGTKLKDDSDSVVSTNDKFNRE